MTKPYNHDEIMSLVPFEIGDMNNLEVKVGIGAFNGRDPLPEPLALYGGMTPQARRLFISAPFSYQTLARVAAGLRGMSDEIDNLCDAGLVDREQMKPLLSLYGALERDCLTAMQIATNGVESVVNSLKKEPKR